MNKIKIKQIVFTKINTAELLDMGEFDLDLIGENDIAVNTVYSTISCGTEKANLTGDPNVAGGTDYVVPFPRYLGYSSSGRVVKVGNKVTKVKERDKVIIYNGHHKNYNIINQNQVIKVAEGVDFSDAAICFIATFPLAALRKVQLEIGESNLIMGLGILGQLAVKLARNAGAYPVIAADPVESRRKMAIENGADYAFNPFDKNFAEKVKNVTGGGVNTALEITGVGAGLNETLDCMKKFGRVALLGCTRNSDFSIDYYKKVHFPGITLVGAHTAARPNAESYPHWFTQTDDINCVVNLCAGKRLTLKDIIKETHSPEECYNVYTRLINEKEFPVGVQFDWSKL